MLCLWYLCQNKDIYDIFKLFLWGRILVFLYFRGFEGGDWFLSQFFLKRHMSYVL